MNSPVLLYPDPAKSYVLDCDASSDGMGAVLFQEVQEWVVAHFSRKFPLPERNYYVTRKELLVVV